MNIFAIYFVKFATVFARLSDVFGKNKNITYHFSLFTYFGSNYHNFSE